MKLKVGDKVTSRNGSGVVVGVHAKDSQPYYIQWHEDLKLWHYPDGRCNINDPQYDVLEIVNKPEKFTRRWNKFQAAVHDNARDKGWWEEEREFGTLISLCHSELSEAVEAMREGNPASEKIPEFSGVEEELADVVIRIMDLAAHYGFDVAGAMVAKAEFNKTRSKRHGGKRF